MNSEILENRKRAPGRPREFDMDDALDKAIRVFCEQGFHATSITDLTQAMELTPGSIYKAFKDKRAVFLAALNRQMSMRNAQLREALDTAKSGREKLQQALMFYVNLSCGVEGRQGCLVVSTAVELATFDPEIAELVVGSLQRREKLLAGLIRTGQEDGSVSAAIDIQATARFMLCLLQGLRVIGKTSPTQADMAAVVDIAMRALD